MNWEAIGAIGEVISAIAVLVTLVYLAIQVRHNSRMVWSQNLHSATAEYQKIAEIQARPEVSTAVVKCINDQELDDEEFAYMEAYLITAFSMYANQFEHVQAGIEVPNWKNSRKKISTYLGIPWTKRWWDEFGYLGYSSEFNNEVKKILSETPPDMDYVHRVSANDT